MKMDVVGYGMRGGRERWDGGMVGWWGDGSWGITRYNLEICRRVGGRETVGCVLE